jgi:hypothetical protein
MTRFQYVTFVVFLLALVVVALGTAFYFYMKAGATEPRSQEAAEIIAAVSKLMVLPEGEEPTVATVSDPAQLADQPFFSNAKVGHKVLIYTKARKAILYDPAAHKIVEVAPLNLDSGAGALP